MSAAAIPTLIEELHGALRLGAGGAVEIADETALREHVDVLAWASAFGDPERQAAARWLLWEAGRALGIVPASIHELYIARGRGETPSNFTVPAINVRAMAFDCGRAVFRAACARDVGALIFEIARSEIGYTGQRPAEYIASLMAAAIKEGFRGPLFIQGDHFQISAARYSTDPEGEMGAVRELTEEAIGAGFYNIDVDTSTLVDLDLPTLDEQQRLNASLCADLTTYIRELEPEGVTVSVGGEIGEVGSKNSTPEELHAFMGEYNRHLADGLAGLSKISIQTGTAHGGIVLADGTLAQVSVDFDILAELSVISREDYGMAGAVQHGASTLPEEAFGKFAEADACEVHLATGFQNMMFDGIPDETREEIYDWLRIEQRQHWKDSQTEDQFLYSNRKRALGPFKKQLWGLSEEARASIRDAWERQFGFLFERLAVTNTCDLVAEHVTPVAVARTAASFGVREVAMEDVSDLAD
jgi:fructose/tagatose bisphosphate aldolase